MYYLIEKTINSGVLKSSGRYAVRTSFVCIEESYDNTFKMFDSFDSKYYVYDSKTNRIYMLLDSTIDIANNIYENEIRKITNEFIVNNRIKKLNKFNGISN